MEKASKEKIQRKEVFQPKHVNGMSRSEILRRKFHALFGGRCLEVSSASLIVNLRCVPVCVPPHSVPDCRTPLLFCLHHRTSSQRCYPSTVAPYISGGVSGFWMASWRFKCSAGDSNAARGRDHKNRSAAVTTTQIRRHWQVVILSHSAWRVTRIVSPDPSLSRTPAWRQTCSKFKKRRKKKKEE